MNQEQNRQHKNQKHQFKLNRGLYFIDVDKYAQMSTTKLWEKKQRKVFFFFIFLFFLAVLALNIIGILEIAFWVKDQDNIVNNWVNYYNDPDFDWDNGKYFWKIDLINMCTMLGFSILILVFLSLSILKCIKNKTFSNLSMFSTIFIFIQCIYGLFDLIRYAVWGVNIVDSFDVSWVYLLEFITPFIYIFIWFFISRNVSLIRKIAISANIREQQEAILRETMGYGKDHIHNHPDTQEDEDDNGNPEFNTNDSFYLRLKKLNREQLNEFAKALSISSYESMSDDELIKIIYDIKNVQDKDTKEREIKSEKDDENDKEKLN